MSLDIGIRALATNNTLFWNNTITGIDASAFNISSLSYNLTLNNNSFSSNEIDVEVADSNFTLFVNQSAQNYSFIRAGFPSFANSSARLDFTNGSITATGNLSFELRLGFNLTFVNSTYRTGLNTTANITFFDLPSANNPEIMVDREDDGTFIPCNATTLPKCEELSFSGGTFVFNVTHFTTFSSRNNTPPGAPVLILPANNTVITNRTPTFLWNNSEDNESDTKLYNLLVANASSFALANIVINQTSIAEDSDGNTSFTPTSALRFDVTYFWRVRANDSAGNIGQFSTTFNFTLESVLEINLSTAIINFINLSPPDNNYNDTEDDNPAPFLIENTGNVGANVTFNGTRLWQEGAFPSSNYQYRINNTPSEPGSFNYTGSTVNWSNVTNNAGSPLRVDIMQLNYTDVGDLAEIELNITVPSGEAAGIKISNVSIVVDLGE